MVNDHAPKDRNVTTVFQSFALSPHMTVGENMGFALELAHVPRDEIDRKVAETARMLDLEGQLDRKPSNLSGGQRQRVAMGRAVVCSPRAFLMDEPLSNPDAQLRVQTRAEIARIQQALGTTTLYATHDQIDALTLGDRIAVMRAGALQQVGRPGQIYGHPDNLFVAGFIGSPSMNFMPGHLDGECLSIPIGEVRVTDGVRRRLRPGLGAGSVPVIVGIRPEHFEDAALVRDRTDGPTFTTTIDVRDSMGSEYYAHFTVPSEPVFATELRQLAQHNGTGEIRRLPQRVRMVARLGHASRIRQGQVAELWFDTTQLHLFDDRSGRNLLDGDASDSGRAAA